MKNVKINDWMRRDMMGYFFFAVYAISPIEWWILGEADTYEEAAEMLKNEMADAEEGDEGEWMIIDHKGKRVKG